jgi:ATP/maltotriose-dependent transcriptional regulator MalT/DNA-binding SARP family transcriptional activator
LRSEGGDDGAITGGFIERGRLLDRLLRAPIGLVEAGAGYGKSVLVSQYRRRLGIATAYVPLGPPDADPGVLVGSLRRALAAARLSDLIAVTEGATSPQEWVERLLDALSVSDDGLLIAFDDAHHLRTPESAALLVRLARVLPPPHRLFVASRGFMSALETLRTLPDAVRVDAAELAFTLPEAARLLRAGSWPASDHDVRVVHETTRGWATALVLASRGRPAGATDPTDLVGAPLRAILDTMDAEDRRLAEKLAHLPVISPELADAIASESGGFERVIAAGIPIARVDTGWWEMPSPVAAYLSGQTSGSGEAARTAADVYQRHGADLLALRTLMSAGDHRDVASLLAAMDPVRAERLGLGVLEDLVASLDADSVAGHPRVLLHLARLAEQAHRADLRSAALTRATGASSRRPGLVIADELDAELARDLMWDTRTRRQARELAEAVTERAGASEIARARALDALGRLDCWFSETGPRPEAEARLLQSARLARGLGQRTWTAQALVALGSGFHFARCEYGRALEVLDEALDELPARNRYRAMVHAFRAETLIEQGRLADAEVALREMRGIGAACRERWVLAYAAWQEAELASYRGDAGRTVDAYHEALRQRDDWYEQPSGLEFEVQSADYLSRVGEHERALEALDRARERRAASEHLVAVHEAAVLARSGDPDEAWAAIVAALEDPASEPQERWPLLVLRAHVAWRRGDSNASSLAAEAFTVARELGHPEGPLIRERGLAERLLALAARNGSAAAVALQHASRSHTWEIVLLGRFAVSRSGERIELPAGRAALVVRIVAAAGGRIHAEQLTEHLWPEASPAAGRNRLRNLLSRVRTATGGILVRDGPAITLAPETAIDSVELERETRAARRAASEGNLRRAARLARTALERAHGEFLPDDAYAEWAFEPRRRSRACELELIDLLLGAAERQGEIDEAVRLARRAIELAPDDAERYRALAALLRSQGRTGAASAVLRRGDEHAGPPV